MHEDYPPLGLHSMFFALVIQSLWHWSISGNKDLFLALEALEVKVSFKEMDILLKCLHILYSLYNHFLGSYLS